jgi:hypothetical protein
MATASSALLKKLTILADHLDIDGQKDYAARVREIVQEAELPTCKVMSRFGLGLQVPQAVSGKRVRVIAFQFPGGAGIGGYGGAWADVVILDPNEEAVSPPERVDIFALPNTVIGQLQTLQKRHGLSPRDVFPPGYARP